MTDNRNTILAVILSGLVLIAWQYFYNMPQMEKQRAALHRDFATMLDDLRQALLRLDRQGLDRQGAKTPRASSSEVDAGSRQDNASQQDNGASRNPN